MLCKDCEYDDIDQLKEIIKVCIDVDLSKDIKDFKQYPALIHFVQKHC